MAEYVEQRMEEMLGEVEQMERVNLLEPKEVRELIKKRKHFEYKIQKKTKEKGDYLAYIQYESNLLGLLALRRENVGYQHKKAEIEGGIKVRINKLFKILEHRFQSDVTVWLSHVAFLKEAQWEASVSRIYLRMLQVHSGRPGLWVAAAHWEFHHLGNAENARQLMLRALRFQPRSWTLHREYLKLELLYVEQLRKRAEVLGSAGELEDPEGKDGVMDCTIVRLVAKAALEAVDSPELAVSLLNTLNTFAFAEGAAGEVVSWLETRHPDHPATLDTLARRELLQGEGGLRERLGRCLARYLAGLEGEGGARVLALGFSTLRELLESAPRLQTRVMAGLLDLLRQGRERGLLAEQHFQFWLSCLSSTEAPEEVTAVAEAAVAALPGSAALWVERLAAAAARGEAEAVFPRALAALAPCGEAGTVRVWEAMLRLQGPEAGWRLLQEPAGLLDRGLPGLRLLHLQQAGARGLPAAREAYAAYRLLPPFARGLHYAMAALEQEADRPSLPHVRAALETAADQFGAADPLPWLALVRLEGEAGRPLEAARTVCRAEAALGPGGAARLALLREREGV